jgi:hypothetical protein
MPSISLTDWYREKKGLPVERGGEQRDMLGLLPVTKKPQQPKVRRVDEPYPIKTVVWLAAVEGMLEEIRRYHPDSTADPHDGVETGGYLAGRWSDDGELRILRASGIPADAKRERDRVVLDRDAARELERTLPPEWFLCGDWHLHNVVGDTSPSPADMKTWARAMKDFGLARWVGVIVSPHEVWGLGMTAHYTAWVISRTPDGVTCQPAEE